MRRAGIAVGLVAFTATTAAWSGERGPYAVLGADVGYIWWNPHHEHALSAPGQALMLDRVTSPSAIDVGGRLALGWKFRHGDAIAALPRLQLTYAQSQSSRSRLAGQVDTYEIDSDVTWLALDAGADLHLAKDWLMLGLGLGVAQTRSVESVSAFATASDGFESTGYLLHWSVGVRYPPKALVCATVRLGFEVSNFSPFGAFWDGRWYDASRALLTAGVELDGTWLRDEEAE